MYCDNCRSVGLQLMEDGNFPYACCLRESGLTIPGTRPLVWGAREALGLIDCYPSTGAVFRTSALSWGRETRMCSTVKWISKFWFRGG